MLGFAATVCKQRTISVVSICEYQQNRDQNYSLGENGRREVVRLFELLLLLFQELLVPLLELMEMAARSQSHGNKELQQKAAHVFNSLCKIRKVTALKC